jgi:rubrerythrin
LDAKKRSAKQAPASNPGRKKADRKKRRQRGGEELGVDDEEEELAETLDTRLSVQPRDDEDRGTHPSERERDEDNEDSQDGEDAFLRSPVRPAASSKKAKKKNARKAMSILQSDDEAIPGASNLNGDDALDEILRGTSKRSRPGKRSEQMKQAMTARMARMEAESDAAGDPQNDTPDAESEAQANPSREPVAQAPSASAGKKNAKRADKSAAKNADDASWKCNVCTEIFQSRNKLMAHVRETGHALAVPGMATEEFEERKGKKGKGRR